MKHIITQKFRKIVDNLKFSGSGTFMFESALILALSFLVSFHSYGNSDRPFGIAGSDYFMPGSGIILTDVMINSCGQEGDQEFLTLTTANEIDLNLLTITYNQGADCSGSNSHVYNGPYTPVPAGVIDEMNGAAGCTAFVLAPNPLPAGSTFLIFDKDLNVSSYETWTAYCDGTTYYVVFTDLPSSSGNFSNAGGATRSFCLTYNGSSIGAYTYTNPGGGTVDGSVASWTGPGHTDTDVPSEPTCSIDPSCDGPKFDYITSESVCGSYILPEINGTNLSGNELYYTGPKGTGTSYSPGTEITETITLYVFDSSSPCSDEVSVYININPKPDAFPAGPLEACPDENGNASFNLSSQNGTVSGGGSGTVIWYIDPETTLQVVNPGNFVIKNSMTVYTTVTAGGCSSDPVAVDLIVLTPITFTNPLPDVLCVNASSITLPNPLEGISGTWSGTGVAGNQFNPGGLPPSTVTITFTPTPVPGLCVRNLVAEVEIVDEIIPDLGPLSPICESEGAILLNPVQDGVTGVWSGPGVTGNQFDPEGLPAGDITLTFTPDGGQCAEVATTTIEVTAGEVPDLEVFAPICVLSDPIALNPVQDGVTGVWSGSGVIGNQFDPEGLPAGDITLTFTPDGGQCAEVATTTIEVTAGEVPDLEVFAPICVLSDPVTLNPVQDGVTGVWSGSGVIGNQFDPEGLPAGDVTLTFTPDGGQCAEVATTTIEITAGEVPDLEIFAPICVLSDPVALNPVQDGVTGVWSGPGVIGNQFDPEGLPAGDITLTFTPDGGQCAEVATMTIEVTESFIPELDIIQSICALSSPIPLNPFQDGVSGTWYTGGSPVTEFNHGGNAGTYTLTFEPDPAQCAENISIDIEVVEAVTPDINIFSSICDYDILILPYNPDGVSGYWSGPGVSGYEFDPGGLTGTVMLTYTPDFDVCANEVLLPIEILEAPVLNQISTLSFCQDPSEGGVTVNLYDYEHEINGGAGFPLQWFYDITLNIPIGNPGNLYTETNIIVYATTTQSGCTSEPVAVSIIVTDGYEIEIVSSSDPLIICGSDGEIIQVVEVNGANLNYIWTTPSNNTLYGSQITADETGTYYVVGILDECPSNTASVEVIVGNPIVIIDEIITHSLCEDNAGYIEVIFSGGSGNITFHWSDNPGWHENYREDLSAGSYTYEITDELGCTYGPGTIEILGTPVPGLSVTAPDEICIGEDAVIEFHINGEAPYEIVYSINGVVQPPLTGSSSPLILNLDLSASSDISIVSYFANGCFGDLNIPDFNIEVAFPLVASARIIECISSYTHYTVSFEISGGNGGEIVVSPVGSGILDPDNIFVSNPIEIGTNYSFSFVEIGSPCAQLVVSGNSIADCSCESAAAILSEGLQILCDVNEAATVIVVDPGIVGGSDIVEYILYDGPDPATANIVYRSVNPVVFFDSDLGMVRGHTYYMFVYTGPDNGSGQVDLSNTCTVISNGAPVYWDIDIDVEISGQSLICKTDTARAEITLNTGELPYNLYYSVDGVSQNPILINSNPFIFELTPDLFSAEIKFDSVLKGDCRGELNGLTGINVIEDVDYTGIIHECSEDLTTYTVTLYLTGGGGPPYELVGSPAGTISNDTFVSFPILTGDIYEFYITTPYGCDTLSVINTNNCNIICDLEAGNMSTIPLTVCEGSEVSFNYLGGYNGTSADTLLFVIQNASGQALSYWNTTDLSWGDISSLDFNETYYFAVIATRLDENGNPVFDHQCLSEGAKTPFVITPRRAVTFNGDGNICINQDLEIVFVFSEDGQYTIRYSSDGIDRGEILLTENPGTLRVPHALSEESFSVISVIDENGCIVDITGNIEINRIPLLETGPVSYICNEADGTYIFTFEITGGSLSDYVFLQGEGTINEGLFVSNPITLGESYVLVFTDESACNLIEIDLESPLCQGCAIDAGTIEGEQLEIYCADSSDDPIIISRSAFGFSDNPGEFLRYFLSTRYPVSSPDDIIATGLSPQFGIPSPVPGQSYFIFGLANNIPTDEYDISGECWDITNIIELRFQLNGINNLEIELCNNATYEFEGEVFDIDRPDGSFIFPGMAANGCDSIVNVQLAFVSDFVDNLNMTLCEDESITINGNIYDRANPTGIERLTGSGQDCDTILHVNLSFVQEIVYVHIVEICKGDSVLVNGTYYGENNIHGTHLFENGSVMGCDSIVEINVIVHDLLYELNTTDADCPEIANGSMTLFELTDPTGFYQIHLNNQAYSGSLPYELNNLSPGFYNLTVNNSSGCIWDTSFVIESQFEPVIDMPAFINIVEGDTIRLNAVTNISSPQSVIWNPGEGLSCTDCLNPLASPDRTTIYSLTVVDVSGCSAKAFITVTVEKPDNRVYIPNVIAPNSNSGNSVFILYADNDYVRDYKMTIYNRWGDVLYSKSGLLPNSPNGGWDGTFKGRELSPAVFVYVIEASLTTTDRIKVYSGDVTILK